MLQVTNMRVTSAKRSPGRVGNTASSSGGNLIARGCW